MIECGSLEYAQARLQARHGQRASELPGSARDGARVRRLLDAARAGRAARPGWSASPRRPARTRSRPRCARTGVRAVAEVVAWMPGPWQAALGLVRGAARPAGAAAPGARRRARRLDAQTTPRWRELCAVPPRRARGRAGRRALARAGAAPGPRPSTLARRLAGRVATAPAAAAAAKPTTACARWWPRCGEHGAAFAAAPPGPGGPLRRALQARLSLLLRRAALEPAAAFIHLALCALDLERLRGELLRARAVSEREGGLMLRPRPTRWFEILAARDDATLVLEALARTGAVELEARSGAALPADPAEVTPLLAQFLELSARYRAYWPDAAGLPALGLPRGAGADAAALPGRDPRLGAGRRAADPRAAARRGRARRTAALAARARPPWAATRASIRATWPAPARWWRCGCSCCPPAPSPAACCRRPRRAWRLLTQHAASRRRAAPAGRRPARGAAGDGAARSAPLKGSAHEVPRWLQADAQANRSHVQQRLAAHRARTRRGARRAGRARTSATTLPRALGDAHRAAVGDAQRARARGRRAVLLDHRLDQRRRAATRWRRRCEQCRRARCCTSRRRAGAVAARRCC